MQVAVLMLALVSGLLTVVFIVSGLRRGYASHKGLARHQLVLTTLFSVLTGLFTIWQLVLVAQQLGIGQ